MFGFGLAAPNLPTGFSRPKVIYKNCLSYACPLSCPSSLAAIFCSHLYLCIYEISILRENELRKCGGCALTKEKHGNLVNKVVSSELLKCDISKCYPHMYIKNLCAHLCIYVSDTVLEFWNKYQRPVVSTESAHVSFAHLAAIKTSFERRQKLLPSSSKEEFSKSPGILLNEFPKMLPHTNCSNSDEHDGTVLQIGRTG